MSPWPEETFILVLDFLHVGTPHLPFALKTKQKNSLGPRCIEAAVTPKHQGSCCFSKDRCEGGAGGWDSVFLVPQAFCEE